MLDLFLLYILFSVAVLIGSSAVVIYFFYPQYAIRLNLRYLEWRAGMRIKYVGDENGVFCYGEKNELNNKTSVLFIHGFSASKDQWITCFKTLPSDIHLVALDLPGHGGSSIPPPHSKLNFDFYIKSIKKFMDLSNLRQQKVHLVGCSMGGAIVGIFSATYPKLVKKVTMICPAMETPVDTEFIQQIKSAMEAGSETINADNCTLLPTDETGMKRMMEACCYNKHIFASFRKQLWKGFLTLRQQKNHFYFRLFRELANPVYFEYLEKVAPKITMPSQIIWGANDEILDPSGATLLSSILPSCRHVDVLKRCGHAIYIDRPYALVKALKIFVLEK